MKYSADVVKKDVSVSQFSCQASTQARKKFSFPRAKRITLNNELDAVRSGGKKLRTKNLEVRILDKRSSNPPLLSLLSQASVPRAAVIVPKYSHTIVQRNRLRRRLRELVRIKLLPYISSVDIFIRPLPHAYKLSFAELAEDVDRVVEKLTI